MSDARQPFLFLGNDPALDLLNTTPVTAAGPVDLLGSFADLTRWLAGAGLVSEPAARALRARYGSGPAGQSALARIKAFREALRAAVVAIEAGRAPPANGVAVINEILLLAGGCYQIEPRTGGRFEKVWQAGNEGAAAQTI